MIPPMKDINALLFNETACIEFLLNQEILYPRTTCEHCNHAISRKSKLWRCKSCGKSVSIFKDSFFANSRLTCNEVLLIGYLWLAKARWQTILAITGHSTATITEYLGHYRQLVVSTLENSPGMIGGDGIIVEVDESKLCKRKYNRGHRVVGAWVVGGVERTEERRVFIERVQDRSAETLRDIIARNVAQGSIVHSDLWRGYQRLDELGMAHATVNHSQCFRDPITGVHTNTIEGTWNGLKMSIPPRNRNEDLIDDHLLVFIWRRNNDSNLWPALLIALKTTLYV